MANFSNETVNQVWSKAAIVPGVNSDVWRKDLCGAWIKKDQYGNRRSGYGWEIDHVKPCAKGGKDDLSNLRPLHWENNDSKCDDYPVWKSVVSSCDDKNIGKIQYWEER